jgi:flagellar basal body-associated protein FliL
MKTAVIIIVIVLAILAAAILSLRSSAKKGMPSQDVLDRATQRARELEAQEKSEENRRG